LDAFHFGGVDPKREHGQGCEYYGDEEPKRLQGAQKSPNQEESKLLEMKATKKGTQLHSRREGHSGDPEGGKEKLVKGEQFRLLVMLALNYWGAREDRPNWGEGQTSSTRHTSERNLILGTKSKGRRVNTRNRIES